MTKEELFKKYSINESHSTWNDMVDNWMGVEVYRHMHDGALPESNDKSTKYILDFLDKCNNEVNFMFSHENAGSLYLTSKRMVYRYADQILEELNF